jgi:methionyl-tRNA synthetase
MEELEKLMEANQEPKKEEKPEEKQPESKPEITIDDFAKLDLRVGEVLECEKLEGSDKLLKSKIKVGNEIRQIVSGIAKSFTPEEMVGKKVIVVFNLKPAKLRGTLSEGMILASEDKEGNIRLATIEGFAQSGMVVR